MTWNNGRQLDEVEVSTEGLAGLAAIQTGFLLFRGPAEQGQHYFISLRNAITKTEKVSLVNWLNGLQVTHYFFTIRMRQNVRKPPVSGSRLHF